MEHRLIQGGEQFLPFARSCVAKLKKLGLAYVDQSYEVDSVSIKVRIEPGHEYIRIDGSGDGYMETGQLAWTFPGAENPSKYNPATWYLLDIPANSPFLGRVDKNGKQKNNPAISSASQAIGYKPTDASNPDKVALDAALKLAYKDSTMTKKLAAGLFPPSVYSGKMRRFMQAIYGAAETKDNEYLSIEVDGTSASLTYKGKTGTVPLIYRVHSSCGVITDATGNYWLAIISAPTSADWFVATAYPFVMTSGGKAFFQAMKSSSVNREKFESYVFANGHFNIDAPLVLGEFTAPLGLPISYGWKWSETTNRASIVVHKQVGTGFSDNYWNASTIHASLSISDHPGTGEKVGSVSAQVIDHGAWTDSDTRTFNIFSPVSEFSTAPLELWTLGVRTSHEVLPEFSFSDVSVYGYYVGDTWTPVVVSRTIDTGPWPKYTQSSEGILYPPGIDMTTPNLYSYGYGLATADMSYESLTKHGGTTMNITLDGNTIAGESTYGSHRVMTKTVTSEGGDQNQVLQNGVGVGAPGYTPGDPQGFTLFYSYRNAAGEWVYGNVEKCLVTVTDTAWVGYLFKAWALVIPGGDCAAAYIATRTEASAPGGSFFTTVRSGHGITRFSGRGGSFVPWAGTMDGYNSWYGIAVEETVVSSSSPPPHLVTDVQAFSTVVHGATGIQGGSYTALFDVDQSYPYYDRGMYTYTSSGGRYAMSELGNSPISVNYQHRFVGWA